MHSNVKDERGAAQRCSIMAMTDWRLLSSAMIKKVNIGLVGPWRVNFLFVVLRQYEFF
jgi:hypothetical protein